MSSDPVSPHAQSADAGSRRISVLIADDHQMVASAFASLLSREPDLDVVATTNTLQEAVSLATALRPQVVLLDTSMPDGNGIDVVDRFTSLEARVLVLTHGHTDAEETAALRNGASGIATKELPALHLIHGIRAVARGGTWEGKRFPANGAPAQDGGGKRAPIPSDALTPRERDVLTAVGTGCSNREIATRLRISEDTVKHHMSSLFDKTGTANRLQLVIHAAKRRLIPS